MLLLFLLEKIKAKEAQKQKRIAFVFKKSNKKIKHDFIHFLSKFFINSTMLIQKKLALLCFILL